MGYKNEDLQNKMSAKLGIMKYPNNGAIDKRLIPMVANEVYWYRYPVTGDGNGYLGLLVAIFTTQNNIMMSSGKVL